MANDCLVTKLKATVDNSDLSKIGEVKFILTHPAGNIVHLGLGYPYTPQDNVRAVGATATIGSFYPNMNSWDINPLSGEPFPVFIKDKYNVEKLFLENSLCTVDFSDLYVMSKLKNCKILNIENTDKVSLAKIIEINPNIVQLELVRQDRAIESSDSVVLSNTSIVALNLKCDVTWNHKEDAQAIYNIRGVDFGDTLDNFLVDMAAVVNAGRMGSGGTCNVRGTLTGSSAETTAIATLKTAYTVQFTINGDPM